MRALLNLNTMLLSLDQLKNQDTGAYVDGVAGVGVTAALLDHASQVAITQGAVTLTYRGLNGKWAGLVRSDIGVTLDQEVDCDVSIDGGTVFGQGKIRIPCTVNRRTVE